MPCTFSLKLRVVRGSALGFVAPREAVVAHVHGVEHGCRIAHTTLEPPPEPEPGVPVSKGEVALAVLLIEETPKVEQEFTRQLFSAVRWTFGSTSGEITSTMISRLLSSPAA